MFLIVPRRVDVAFKHLPVANLVIMGLIVAGFFAFRGQVVSWSAAGIFGLPPPYQWSLGDVLWYMWAHSGWVHLLGNLLFLWVFGNAVCTRVGNVAYPIVYLGAGILAILPHALFGGGPAVGASGAISGLIGMTLVLQPSARLSCTFVLFPTIWNFRMRSYWAIVAWFLLQALEAVFAGGNVLYSAHIAGFIGGCGLAVILLKGGLAPSEAGERSVLEMLSARKEQDPQLEWNAWVLRRHAGKKALWRSEDFPAVKEILPHMLEPGPSVLPLDPPPGYFVSFVCRCGAELRAPRKGAGKEYTCPRCAEKMTIPANDSAAPPQARVRRSERGPR